ncbi:uncharacterized protein LOC131051019 isoform X2 [Cryptomeria japonica]|uniref:uncharacterized protein LOC131051019 isoform X2 n=1 Tax=Cryptomeria japonica TaxID=3369 RepID=UPI0027DA6C32|nr:uncharacterized protein LOC131051019 isoform X2 [Cryptomeria japonica]
MAELESSLLSEQGESRECDGDVNNHHEVCVPMIAECISDRALVGHNCVSPGECGLEDGGYTSENLIHVCSGGKIFENSEAKSAVLGLKSGCPKELLDARIQLDPKGVVSMDLIEKMEQGVDLESGKEISGANGCDNSFWGSAKRLFRRALDSFVPGDLSQSFNGSTKTVGSTFRLCKSASDLRKSGIAYLSQKSECDNGGNPRNTEVLSSGKLRNGNVNNIKANSKKPPRPPRPPKPAKTTVDPSKERLVKAILRRARLERMITLKKKQIARSKSSNSSVWALAFTLCFCVIMILQGMFSQGNDSAQISPEAAVQTSAYSEHNGDDRAIMGEAWYPMMHEFCLPKPFALLKMMCFTNLSIPSQK